MVALGERASPNGQELLAEFIQYGHQRPFEEIVRRYAGMVFNVCFRITKDKHEAEDAVQAVFLTLALQAKRGAEIKALGPWLQQVAKRLALDIRRSKKRRKTREERHHAEQTFRRESILQDTLPSADMDELKSLLHEELQKLPAKYRLPLILHYFGGLSREEMAAELNCKPSTLGVRIFRGREMLAGRLSGRGIHLTGAALAALLGYAVKRAVSDALIASTSRAATAMLAGHDGSGMASAHVISLTRRATSAFAMTKLKMAGLTLLLSGASLGAGAKALGMLPAINVQQMLANQLRRMVQPLLQPLDRPMLSQAPSQPASTAMAVQPAATDYIVPVATANASRTRPAVPAAVAPAPPPVQSLTVANAAPTPAASGSSEPSWRSFPQHTGGSVLTSASSENPQASPAAITADDATTSEPAAPAAGGGAGGASFGASSVAALPPRSSGVNSNLGAAGNVAISTNDLIVGSPNSTSKSASPTAIVEVATNGPGTIIQTDTGILSGYGKPAHTGGTLTNDGAVVANGFGVDQTLNLTGYPSVQTSTGGTATPLTGMAAIGVGPTQSPGIPSVTTFASSSSIPLAPAAGTSTPPMGATSATGGAGGGIINSTTAADAALIPGTINPPSNGWYAIDHGRLCLNLEPSSTNSSVLTWGEDPNSTLLGLTNSVRMTITTDNSDDSMPTGLALLAPDRDDVPNLSAITGTPIGLWQVESPTGEIPEANLIVNYDSLLANALGAQQSSVELWTFNLPTDAWELVPPDTFALDTADHLVYGSAEDFSYFAVSATPSPDTNIEFIIAHQLALVNGPNAPWGGSSSSSVPEPGVLPLLAVTAGLLGRRRRRSSAER